MTAWTWMRYSYAWDTAVMDLDQTWEREKALSLKDRYVRIHGDLRESIHNPGRRDVAVLHDPRHEDVGVGVLHWGASLPVGSDSQTVSGRVDVLELSGYPPQMFLFSIDAGASRFHPASIAGLVVGVMGVFIFGLYLTRRLRVRAATRSSTST